MINQYLHILWELMQSPLFYIGVVFLTAFWVAEA